MRRYALNIMISWCFSQPSILDFCTHRHGFSVCIWGVFLYWSSRIREWKVFGGICPLNTNQKSHLLLQWGQAIEVKLCSSDRLPGQCVCVFSVTLYFDQLWNHTWHWLWTGLWHFFLAWTHFSYLIFCRLNCRAFNYAYRCRCDLAAATQTYHSWV